MGAALVIVVAAGLLVSASLIGKHRRAAGRPSPTRASLAGPAGIAAAYGYPVQCLSISIALHDPRFARADFDHAVPCGRYTGDPTAIFRRVHGRWIPVLDATGYVCPVRALPLRVQWELAVCAAGLRQRAGP